VYILKLGYFSKYFFLSKHFEIVKAKLYILKIEIPLQNEGITKKNTINHVGYLFLYLQGVSKNSIIKACSFCKIAVETIYEMTLS
jgi:hypothetical protein